MSRFYRGCDCFYITEIKKDTVSIYETGTPEKLGILQAVTLSPFKTVTQVIKDGLPVDVYHSEVQGAGLIFSTEGLTDDFIAYLTGQGVNKNNGVFIDTGRVEKKYFACSCRLKYSDNTYKYIWYQKGVFSLQERAINTQTGTETVGTVLIYTPLLTTHIFSNGYQSRSVTIDTVNFERKINIDNWVSMVWTPDNFNELQEPLIMANEVMTSNDVINISSVNDIEIEVLND